MIFDACLAIYQQQFDPMADFTALYTREGEKLSCRAAAHD